MIEEGEHIRHSARIFVFLLFLVACIYFNRWWLWVLLVANTFSDFVYPLIVQKRNKTNEEEKQ